MHWLKALRMHKRNPLPLWHITGGILLCCLQIDCYKSAPKLVWEKQVCSFLYSRLLPKKHPGHLPAFSYGGSWFLNTVNTILWHFPRNLQCPGHSGNWNHIQLYIGTTRACALLIGSVYFCGSPRGERQVRNMVNKYLRTCRGSSSEEDQMGTTPK